MPTLCSPTEPVPATRTPWGRSQGPPEVRPVSLAHTGNQTPPEEEAAGRRASAQGGGHTFPPHWAPFWPPLLADPFWLPFSPRPHARVMQNWLPLGSERSQDGRAFETFSAECLAGQIFVQQWGLVGGLLAAAKQSARRSLGAADCTLQCAACTGRHTVCGILCAAYSIQCTVYSIQHTVSSCLRAPLRALPRRLAGANGARFGPQKWAPKWAQRRRNWNGAQFNLPN